MKILLLDDNAVLSSLMAMQIERENHLTFRAQTIGEAKKIMEEQEIDIAVVDLSLSGESGEDFIIFLKEHRPLVYIIVATGIHYHSLREIAEKYGVAYLQKPFEINQLLNLLEPNGRKFKLQ